MNGLIRQATVLIVKRGAEYLVGTVLDTRILKWSTSPWDAWRTRDREQAKKVAGRLGGDIWLFNPVAGQIREAQI